MHICRTGRYSAYCAHTKSTPKSACHCFLVPLLQNCEVLSIKHDIDLVRVLNIPDQKNSSWLKKVKRIFKTVNNKLYARIEIFMSVCSTYHT